MIVSFKLQYARRQCVVCYAETPEIVKYVSIWCLMVV